MKKNPFKIFFVVIALALAASVGLGLYVGLTPSGPSASTACEVAMQKAAAATGADGENLLRATGNICRNQVEWDAALRKFPEAIGGSSVDYLDGTEFALACRTYPELTMCPKG